MTYEELLNYVMVECALAEKNNYPIKPLSALLAVVELHKLDPYNNDFCAGCEQRVPCGTIQDIQKELK